MCRWFLAFVLTFLPLALCGQSVNSRPRVGVVLSGGGAKGAAHIGVLRAVEEAGIPIDYIAGTSMGAIVGGLYALGYSTEELDTLVRMQDWELLLSDKTPRKLQSLAQRERAERLVLHIPLSRSAKPELNGLVRGRNLGNLLARLTVGYHDSISFDSLHVPFACVATNLANGEEVVMRSGRISTAIRASMAIPGAFTPVVLHGKTLVDGGLSNNFPVDVARKMGADIVIGATVQRVFTDTMEVGGMQGVIQQLISIASRHKFEENIRNCDLYLGINPQGVSTMDFKPALLDTMLYRGYAKAISHWDELMQIADRVGVPRRPRPNLYASVDSLQQVPVYPTPRTHYRPLQCLQAQFPVRRICFDRITEAEERMIRHTCALSDSSVVSQQQIERAVLLLNERFLYLDANYSLNESDNCYDLVFHAVRRLSSQVGVGARFDTEEMASLLLQADIVVPTRVPLVFDTSIWLGEQYGAQFGLTVEPRLNRQFNVYYRFRHSDFNLNRKGNRAFNLVFQYQQVGISFAYRQTRNFDAEVGFKFSRFGFTDVLVSGVDTASVHRPVSDTYFTAYLRLRYNSQNRGVYPTSGSKMVAEYAFTTDNLTLLKQPHAFSAVQVSWETVLPFTSRLALQPRLASRLVLNQEVPFVYGNMVGGYGMGRFMPQQLPFIGLNRMERFRNALAMFDFKLRYRFYARHYAFLLGALMAEQRDVRHLRRAAYHYGVGLRYGYDSKFGPVEATVSYSGLCRKPAFYVKIGFDF